MRSLAKGLVLAGLALTGCGGAGYGLVGFGLGVGVGFLWDDYYDDCCDYDCGCALWAPSVVATTSLEATVDDATSRRMWLATGAAPGGCVRLPTELIQRAGNHEGGVEILDANADSVPDLVVLDGNPRELVAWAGDGRGGFARILPTRTTPRPLAPSLVRFARGLVDGDAIDDAVTLDGTGAIHVALGTGAGEYSDRGAVGPATEFLGPDAAARIDGVWIAIAAFDALPGADLVIVDAARERLGIFSGRGDGSFGPAKVAALPPLGDVLGVAPMTVAVDPTADIAVLTGVRADLNASSLLRVVRPTDGTVVFEPMPVDAARFVFPVDLDRNGITDLLLADASGRAIHTLHAKP